MSKRTPATTVDPRETPAYWKSRLFRNSYTRAGRRFQVRHWSVKVQLNGVRETWSLAAFEPDLAAKEASERFRARRQSRAETPPPTRPAPPRLVQRSHVPRGTVPAQLFLQQDTPDGPAYFPLGTAAIAAAQARAQRILSEIRRAGPGGMAGLPLERTLALEWSDNPVVWTYFTLHTNPAPPRPRQSPPASKPAPTGLSVSILEPDPGLRQALLTALGNHEGINCEGGYGTVAEALEQLSRKPVSVVLANHSLDGLSGAGFLGRLRVLSPGIQGLTYSVYNDSNRLFAATPGGSAAYLLKRTPAERCLEPLLSAQVPAPDPPALARAAMVWFQRMLGTPAPAPSTGDLARLTTREHDILALMSKGFLDKEIAQSLQISVWTVHGHAKRIFEKLKVHSRTEAAVRYLQK